MYGVLTHSDVEADLIYEAICTSGKNLSANLCMDLNSEQRVVHIRNVKQFEKSICK